MLTAAEPDRTTLVRSIGPEGSASRIVIQNGHARDFGLVEPAGAFSLKWIPRGAALYSVERLRHRLFGDRVLLLNAGQSYELEFLDRTGTESLCLFFSEPLLREARSDTLDEVDPPSRPGTTALPDFPDIVFRAEPAVARFLVALRSEFARPDTPPEHLEEQLLLFLNRLIAISQDHRGLAERIPAARPRTRHMLAGRLQRARDLIEDSGGATPRLDELAAASGLSRFHMLRLFKAAFSSTPSKYAEVCKIRRAMQLLKHTRRPIGEIAAAVGYESQSAFTRSFSRHAGMTPRTYRGNAQ
jgi:AraC-like DNA-binding protein